MTLVLDLVKSAVSTLILRYPLASSASPKVHRSLSPVILLPLRKHTHIQPRGGCPGHHCLTPTRVTGTCGWGRWYKTLKWSNQPSHSRARPPERHFVIQAPVSFWSFFPTYTCSQGLPVRGYFSSSATEEKGVTPDSGSFVGRSLQPDLSSGYSHSSPGPFLGSACPRQSFRFLT